MTSTCEFDGRKYCDSGFEVLMSFMIFNVYYSDSEVGYFVSLQPKLSQCRLRMECRMRKYAALSGG